MRSRVSPNRRVVRRTCKRKRGMYVCVVYYTYTWRLFYSVTGNDFVSNCDKKEQRKETHDRRRDDDPSRVEYHLDNRVTLQNYIKTDYLQIYIT